MKPKLIKKIDGTDKWNRVKYEMECAECGEHYIIHAFGKNTGAYCYECSQRHYRKRQKQRQISKILEPIRAEIEAIEPSKVQYGMRYADTTLMIPLFDVLRIIDKHMK